MGGKALSRASPAMKIWTVAVQKKGKLLIPGPYVKSEAFSDRSERLSDLSWEL